MYKMLPTGVVVVVPSEHELDLQAAQGLAADLQRAAQDVSARIVVDLTGVTYLDSSGIGALVHGRNAALERGGRLVLLGACGAPRKILRLSGVDQVMPVVGSVDDAVAALLGSPTPEAPEPGSAPATP